MTRPRYRRLVAIVSLLLGGSTWTATVRGQEPGRSYTPEELRRAGQQLFYEEIFRYGRIDNAAWNEDMSAVLDRLQAVTGHPGLQVAWAIVDRDEFNAWAGPGGHIVVYRPMYEWIESVVQAEVPEDPARRSERQRAYLATVLSHELSHILLGHTGGMMSRMRALVDEATWERLLDSSPINDSDLSFDPATLASMEYGRAKELAADSVGALAMLRAGWQIQDAMQWFRYLDQLERGTEEFYVLPTWGATHPRASQREASLEGFRADLKLDQTRLDDAITLIRLDAQLDVAIDLLDSVLAHFPDLLAVRHARVSALHRKWLNTVPLQVQQVRSTLALFGAHFLPGIRGEVGDSQLLDQARQGYREVLEVLRFPETLSNLALLEAYSENHDRAKELAREAGRLEPENAEILNNLGAVLFLSGELPEALSVFERAKDLSGEWEGTAIVFNIGRTQLAMEDSRGQQTLERYLELDEVTNWRAYAQSLLGGSPATTGQEAPRPTPAGAVTVSAGGVDLGISDRQMFDTLGAPEWVDAMPSGVVFHYDSRGLFMVLVENRVVFIGIEQRSAGSIGGIQPGDSLQAARERFGKPAGHRDNLLFYAFGDRTVVIAEENGTVAEIGIGFS